MNEKPRKRPRAPPNSARKEVKGYKRTSSSIHVLLEATQKASEVFIMKPNPIVKVLIYLKD